MTPDRGAAFKAERAEMIAFCDALRPAEWRMDSRAPGWRIQDVVAHLGSGCHVMFTPSVRKLLRGNDIEHTNDVLVDARRDRSSADVVAEYRRWSAAVAAIFPALGRTPLGAITLPLAELGRFPMRLVLSGLVFDHHTHLRHDMAPALGRPAPGTDANRMAAVCEWMMLVLSNQLRAARPPWLDRPVSITLRGPGGGGWVVAADGSVTAGREGGAAEVTGVALEFPEWGTRRAGWRDRDVVLGGDADYAAAFLDAVNVI